MNDTTEAAPLRSAAEIAEASASAGPPDKTKRDSVHAAIKSARGPAPKLPPSTVKALASAPAASKDVAAPIAPQPGNTSELRALFPSLFSKKPGESNTTVSSPRQTARMDRVLAWLGIHFDTPGLLNKIKQLDADWELLQKRISDSNPRLRKEDLKLAHGQYTADPSAANYAIYQAAQFNEPKLEKEFQMCKAAVHSFAEKHVRPVMQPIYLVILPRLLDAAQAAREREEEACAALGIETHYSELVKVLECTAYHVKTAAEGQTFLGNVRPSSLFVGLGMVESPAK